MLYITRKIRIGKTDQLDQLARASGELYSRVVKSFWRTVRKKNIWISKHTMQRWHKSADGLHSHSADAVVENFYAALKSWRARRKKDPNSKPPRRLRQFFKVVYKSGQIRIKNDDLVLSNGKNNKPVVVIDWKFDLPKYIEIVWNPDINQYEVCCLYAEPEPVPVREGDAAGIDLGEIHIAVAHTKDQCIILNGRELRAKRRYQNKIKAFFQQKLSAMKKGSRRHRKLSKSKNKQLRRINNQIKDILHKQTTRFVSTLHERGVKTVVIGDVTNIRVGLDKGKKINQKLHQWTFGQTTHMLTYKSKRFGMEIKLQNETYTSQTCPFCGHKTKPTSRTYSCSLCGFEGHRDGVGAFNIRKKYLESKKIPVVGDMISPIGVRYEANACVARQSQLL